MNTKVNASVCNHVRPSQQKDIPGTYAGYPDEMFGYPTIVLICPSLDTGWTSQGYRHFRLTGYNPVGLKYPAQDISIYNNINNHSEI